MNRYIKRQINRQRDKQIDRFKYDFDIFDVLIDWWIEYILYIDR